jgi:GAF domain-containing protein
MRRRSKASSKVATARSPKAKTLKAVRRSSSSASGQETEVERLTRELHEAQKQQIATAEVLKIISTPPAELQPVLEVVVRSAARFCEADDVTIFELDGQYLRIAAHWGAIPQEIGVRFPCVPGQVAGRAVLERKAVHVIDLQAEREEFPEGSAFARRLGHRTTAAVPLLREGVAVGTIMLRRAEANPFTDKQITLLETFAAQAVIAIENTRLLNELRQRTDDLTESLEQQTATSKVLSVISSPAGELEPVFQTMLENAVRICEAKFGIMYRFDGDAMYPVAMLDLPPALHEFLRQRGRTRPTPGGDIDKLRKFKQVVHTIDMLESPVLSPPARLAGGRTQLVVPMLKENELIGSIIIYRQEVRPFTEKQIALVQSFAAQAVIAIENTRLLNELRQRTDDLSESLEQQTATSEILSSMSGSMADTKPVFDAILHNLLRLFGTSYAVVHLLQDGTIHLAAFNGEPGFERLASHYPRPLDDSTVSGRAILSPRRLSRRQGAMLIA